MLRGCVGIHAIRMAIYNVIMVNRLVRPECQEVALKEASRWSVHLSSTASSFAPIVRYACIFMLLLPGQNDDVLPDPSAAFTASFDRNLDFH
jgi:hypothetical protein